MFLENTETTQFLLCTYVQNQTVFYLGQFESKDGQTANNIESGHSLTAVHSNYNWQQEVIKRKWKQQSKFSNALNQLVSPWLASAFFSTLLYCNETSALNGNKDSIYQKYNFSSILIAHHFSASSSESVFS